MAPVDRREVEAALATVPGVASAAVDSAAASLDGASAAGMLRLSLVPGADEVEVATAVHRVLRERFGLGVDANRIEVVDETEQPDDTPVPEAADGRDQPTPPPVPEAGPVSSGWPGAPRLTVVPAADDPVVVPLPKVTGVALAAFGRPVALDEEELEPDEMGSRTRHPSQAAFVNDLIERVTESYDPPAPGPDVDPAPREAVASHEGAGESDPVVPDPSPGMHAPDMIRLAIARVQIVAAGFGVAVTVTLGLGDVTFTGNAEGPNTPSGIHRAVAGATLGAVREAVAESLGSLVRMDIEAVEVPQVGIERVVVVQVSLASAAGVERLTGACEAGEDVRRAVVRATLDALNRRLETLLAAI